MTNNRRSFLKRVSVAGAAALAGPRLLSAAAATNDDNWDASATKTFLFQGDSITDGGRSYDTDWNHVYGQGYAYLITSRLSFDYPGRNYSFFNRGISGNTVADLAGRWQKDTLSLKPDLLSILIGVNDAYAVVEKDQKNTPDDFGDTYDKLLQQTRQALPNVQLVVCQPFILPVGMVQKKLQLWTREVNARQPIVKALADKHSAIYVPFQDEFNKALTKAPANHWIWDGVHPMPAGHELMARLWVKTVNKHYKIL